MAGDDQELFLVRIWAEPRELSEEPAVYRGWVEHVSSARSTYFAEVDQIVPFVRQCLEEEGRLPPGGFADELEN